MSNWKCSVCGKESKSFGIKQFAACSKTTLFGDFKVRDIGGKINAVGGRMNKSVCSEKCKQKNEEQYLVDEYKGNKIYCVDGKYMPYLECDYWYDSIEGVKNRIDNPNLVPVTPNLMHGLAMAMSGEPSNI